MNEQLDFDALVVGTGFGGIYMLYKLRQLGLSVKLIDVAGGVGGTWYWNRYPGAMSDTESYMYRYSWDLELLRSYPWENHYLKQPEIMAYLNHVVDRYDLRKYIQLNTEMLGADYDEGRNVWRVKISTGEVLTVRYLVTALGLLSRKNYPDIPGIDTFQGEKYHTAAWPEQYSFKDKRIAVIGNGSTGVQIITYLGKNRDFKSVTSFQRHPQYSVPSGDGPVSKEYREWVNANYPRIWDEAKNKTAFAFGYLDSSTPAMSVSAEERQRKFQESWDKGNGFRFLGWTFGDLTFNEEANEAACEFIRSKIAEIVKDPEKRRKLTPHDLYNRRPLCDSGYYEAFNHDNIDVVLLPENPITTITPKGIKTADGVEHEFDMIIFATGFDAVDGNYTRLRIHGRGGESLADHWRSDSSSYLGIAVSNFPNLFMLAGPKGPFTNIPPALEAHVEIVAELIEHGHSGATIEATPQAEAGWSKICEDLVANSLFKRASSWIFGANVAGKKKSTLFYFGGLANFRQQWAEIVKDGYRGFTFDPLRNAPKITSKPVELTSPSVPCA